MPSNILLPFGLFLPKRVKSRSVRLSRPRVRFPTLSDPVPPPLTSHSVSDRSEASRHTRNEDELQYFSQNFVHIRGQNLRPPSRDILAPRMFHDWRKKAIFEEEEQYKVAFAFKRQYMLSNPSLCAFSLTSVSYHRITIGPNSAILINPASLKNV